MPPTGHSALGASSAYRWLACPGSVALSADMPNKSSSYAKEGTAAHQLAEECLREGRNPHTYINGGTVTLEDSDGNQEEYEVSADMASAVFTYWTAVREKAAELGIEISDDNLEKRFHLDWIDEELYGTNDLSMALPFDTLYVRDYKHGKGVPVDVVYPEPITYFCGGSSDKNPQLMYYALGAVGAGNEHFVTDIELTVDQPRASHPDGPSRSVKLSLDELYKWRDEVLIPGIAETRKPNAPLCAGSHCKFCKAISVCPEVGKEAMNVAGVTAAQVFGTPKPLSEVHPVMGASDNEILAQTPMVEPLIFPIPADLTPKQRLKLYEFAGLFESWMSEVKKDTHDRMLRGEEIPGLKVVAGRASRKWADEAQVQPLIVNELGVDAFNSKLKSPAQVEKALKEIGADKDLFADHINTVKGQSIVPESDKRQALPVGAAQVFTENN